MMYVGLVLCLAAAAYAQERFVLPNDLFSKIPACEKFAFFLAPPNTDGTIMIDRTQFMLDRYTMSCAPGTLFSLDPNLCVCDTPFSLPYLYRNERCITMNGNMQGDRNFQIVQRGDPNSYPVFVSGFETFKRTPSNCYGSDALVYRGIDFFKSTSIARSSLSFNLGFSFVDDGIGRQYTLVSTGPCAEDPGNEIEPFSVVLVTGTNQITVRIPMSDRFSTDRTTPAIGEIRCTILTTVSAGNNQPAFTWNYNDATNQLEFDLNMSTGTITLRVTNEDMRIRVGATAPAAGFCQIQNDFTTFLGGRNRFQITPRNCPLSFGRAPENTPMCIYGLQIIRDCN